MEGVRAFFLSALPPSPPVAMVCELVAALAEAERGLAGLDAVTDLLPNPDGFVYACVRREAVLSSQIEGTQSSLDDFVRREAGIEDAGRRRGTRAIWRGGLSSFSVGVARTSADARDRARRIVALRDDHRPRTVEALGTSAGNAFRLLDRLFLVPFATVNQPATFLDLSYGAANTLVASLERLGLLREVTGGARNRVFLYQPYLDVVSDA